MVLLHGKLVVAGKFSRVNNIHMKIRFYRWIIGDTTVGKTAICHVAGGDAGNFPKTYNCVS